MAQLDIGRLAQSLADSLQDPTYCLDDDGDGFARFDARTTARLEIGATEIVVRATVVLASDGEDEIEGAAGEVVEIVVRRVTV